MAKPGITENLNIAKVSAWQAVLVALIAATGGSLTTWIAAHPRADPTNSSTGLDPSDDGTIAELRTTKKKLESQTADIESKSKLIDDLEDQVSKLTTLTHIQSTTAPSTYYSLRTEEELTELSGDVCKKQAAKSLRLVHAEHLKYDEKSVSGLKGGYSIQLVCFLGTGSTLVIASGPSFNYARELGSQLRTEFYP